MTMKLYSQLSTEITEGIDYHVLWFYYNMVYLFHAILQSSLNTM